MLHITNGDSAARLIQAMRDDDVVLPWRDVLHEGPVPAGLSLSELSDVRARYLAQRGWADEMAVQQDFAQRDKVLSAFREHEEVVLWFEHDLYDQLQLIQVLSWFADQEFGITRLSLVSIDRFPGIDRFFGLGQLTVGQIEWLLPQRETVTAHQFSTAQTAWEAFRAPDPGRLIDLARHGPSELRFLPIAFRRFLQEYPWTRDGLGRSERQALQAIRDGHRLPTELFAAFQVLEEIPFMGDSTLWSRLADLSTGPYPLIAKDRGALALPRFAQDQADFLSSRISLTSAGQAVLNGHADEVALNGIDRWFGGVHLQGTDATWRCDGEQLVRI